MTYTIVIGGNQNTVISPIIYLDDKRLHVVKCNINYQTKSEQVDSGSYTMTISGYFDGNTELKNFAVDLNSNMAVEVQ